MLVICSIMTEIHCATLYYLALESSDVQKAWNSGDFEEDFDDEESFDDEENFDDECSDDDISYGSEGTFSD